MDKPVTKAELDQFYGTEVSQAEVKAAIERHVKAFDADDLALIAYDIKDELLEYFQVCQYQSIGFEILYAAKKLIADRVSIELFGRHGRVKADEVEL